MKVLKLGFGLVQLTNSQTQQVNLPPNVAFNPQFAQQEEEKATSESWELGKFQFIHFHTPLSRVSFRLLGSK